LAKPGKWVSWDKIEKEIFPRYLYPIEKSVSKLMEKDQRFGQITLRKSGVAPSELLPGQNPETAQNE
jgi:hypothetical protein